MNCLLHEDGPLDVLYLLLSYLRCARCRVAAATGTNQSGPAPPAACGVLAPAARRRQPGQYSGASTSQDNNSDIDVHLLHNIQ